MRIPPDSIIPQEKLTAYLLRPRKHDDKSRFLKRLGFSPDAPEVLEAAIRQHASQGEAASDGQDIYGESFVVVGDLIGPGGSRRVRSVWIRRSSETAVRLVTLYPAQEKP